MRIISGEFKRRQIEGPPDSKTTRPIPDRVREAVFNLLRGHYDDATVFDGFAGSGVIGLEAVSRGASRCVFVERDRRIAKLLERNIETLGAGDRCEVVVGDALGPAAVSRCPRPVRLVFLDPPYNLVREPAGWSRVLKQASRLVGLLEPGGFLVLRTPWPHVHKRGEVYVGPPPEGDGEDEEDGPVEIVDLAEDDDGAMEAFERELQEAAAAAPPEDAPLAIEGAEGPETHIYGSTAVHLYMRADRQG